jgi:hypothetical protein
VTFVLSADHYVLCVLLHLERQQGLAHYLLNQVALMHATAYTLAKVAQLSQWKPVMEEGYSLVPFSKCCSHARHLPAEFVAAVRARDVAQQAREGRATHH